jgi:hypothetical protein
LTWAQLESLRDRGQLARFHQVSQDRQNWFSAASLARLFPHAEGSGLAQPRTTSRSTSAPPPASSDELMILDDSDAEPSVPTAPTAGEAPTWFFARDDARQGPLRLAEVQDLIDRGEIGPETLLWKSGMADWTPGFLVAELRFADGADAAAVSSGEATLPPRQSRSRSAQPSSSPRTSLLAFASLVLGLLWLCGIGSAAAIVLGALALRQLATSSGTQSGKSLAIAGLILGVVGLAAGVVVFFWFSARAR